MRSIHPPRQVRIVPTVTPAPHGWEPVWQRCCLAVRVARLLRNEREPDRYLYEVYTLSKMHLFVEHLADLRPAHRKLFEGSPGYEAIPDFIAVHDGYRTVWCGVCDVPGLRAARVIRGEPNAWNAGETLFVLYTGRSHYTVQRAGLLTMTERLALESYFIHHADSYH